MWRREENCNGSGDIIAITIVHGTVHCLLLAQCSPDDYYEYKRIFVGSGKSNAANESKKQIDSEPKVHLGKISWPKKGAQWRMSASIAIGY